MKRTFREYKIQRTCIKSFKDYASYKKYLREDFHSRCAYCNLLDSKITTPFEADHMIPREAFDGKRDELETLYENLVYACKKCNMAKGSQYKGDIRRNVVENEYFYDPVKVDYNDIFYRDDTGSICSEDEKGRDMISRLKLYRPIHNMAWLCEMLEKTLKKLEQQLSKEGVESERGKLLSQAKSELQEYYILCQNVFVANYNSKKYEWSKPMPASVAE